jgi:ribonucleotide reductase alpha subunit
MKSEFKSTFAENIFKHKYALTQAQTWKDKAKSIVDGVCGVGTNGKHTPILSKEERDYLIKIITDLKFVPGGRYIYYAGRQARFINNCFLLRGEDDSREEWGALANRSFSCLMSGGGIGIDYSIFRPGGQLLSKTGGIASGPLSLMRSINEIGRNVCQGGSRRSAIYGSLNWQHGDAQDFLVSKNWHEMPIGKEGYTVWDAKRDDFNFNAPLDMTNISLNYDDAWLEQINRGELPETYVKNVRQALMTGEPGLSFNFGEKSNETLRNAPVCADTLVGTLDGYRPVKDILETPTTVWTGKQWARNVVFQRTASKVPVVKVKMTGDRSIRCDPTHPFLVELGGDIYRIPAGLLASGHRLHTSLPPVPGKRTKNPVIEVIGVYPDGVEDVFCADVGVEEHTFMAEDVIISNCCELTSEDDSDVCNIGSINMGAIESLEEFKAIVAVAAKFLICGTVRGQLPYEKVYDVRAKNRRIGLGLMGIHEWLLKRNYRYEFNPELHEWFAAYRDYSESGANEHCNRLYLNHPKGYRAIAPTGTIAILASTTSGIEPLFAVAYKRRYLVNSTQWRHEYVVDSVAEVLVKEGINPDEIETSADLAADPERRIQFQYTAQSYVDHAIASTINLPSWGSEKNNEDKVIEFANLLAKYAHGLRGFTCYPDGSRGGQPITTVPYAEATKNAGVIFEENSSCKDGVCGI